ncbi:sentrin-specific protease 1-like isoform X2 [Ornithodoros turicata]|uniref:sentrin-specific protease 1-like isoform X2 n=1 Tax=Ornithodoros turicata TaxID=34597 RepID=UPI00313888BE
MTFRTSKSCLSNISLPDASLGRSVSITVHRPFVFRSPLLTAEMFKDFAIILSAKSRCCCRVDSWNFEACLDAHGTFAKALPSILEKPTTGRQMADLLPLMNDCSAALQQLENTCPKFRYRKSTKRPASRSENRDDEDGEYDLMRKHVKYVLLKEKAGRPLSKKAGYNVTVEDIHSVLRRNWLNDVVIDVYMQLITEKAEEKEGFNSIHALTTHFFSVLRTRGYEPIEKWTQNVDLFSYRLVLVPVHDVDHWSLAVLNIETKQIDFYDSLGRRNEDCCQILMDFLRREHRLRAGRKLLPDTWDYNFVQDIPMQTNTYDCGAFVCLYAECLGRRVPFEFSSKDLPKLRYRIAYEILEGSLL